MDLTSLMFKWRQNLKKWGMPGYRAVVDCHRPKPIDGESMSTVPNDKWYLGSVLLTLSKWSLVWRCIGAGPRHQLEFLCRNHALCTTSHTNSLRQTFRKKFYCPWSCIWNVSFRLTSRLANLDLRVSKHQITPKNQPIGSRCFNALNENLQLSRCQFDRKSTDGPHDEIDLTPGLGSGVRLEIEPSQNSGQCNFQLVKSEVLTDAISTKQNTPKGQSKEKTCCLFECHQTQRWWRFPQTLVQQRKERMQTGPFWMCPRIVQVYIPASLWKTMSAEMFEQGWNSKILVRFGPVNHVQTYFRTFPDVLVVV